MFEDLYAGYVLIDSSALIAIFCQKDEHQDNAKTAMELFRESDNHRLFIANLTIYESFTRLRYDADWNKAQELWTFLANINRLTVLSFNRDDENSTREILSNYRGIKISFHDAACAHLMIQKKIGTVFTFDADFSVLGFDRFP